MKPGTTVMPLASKVCVFLPARPLMSFVEPTAVKRPAETAKASARGVRGSIVWTLALTTIRSGVGGSAASRIPREAVTLSAIGSVILGLPPILHAIRGDPRVSGERVVGGRGPMKDFQVSRPITMVKPH